MFDLEAGDDLDLVVQTARMWAESELAPSMREAEASRSVPPDLVSRWHEVGLGGLEVPVALDGAGLGCLARILVNEELAAGDVGQTLALDTLGPVLSAAFEVGGGTVAGYPITSQTGCPPWAIWIGRPCRSSTVSVGSTPSCW